ncbi:HxlR family transcriptional regulator [Paraburkholderia unamae]|uniref:winged helix-turn-helix transcriptional regulator n=1 Tax=Paraburkholderia unamae TaxID=219649 RepID=UPI000DC25681|nr:winged helix-turn-helix transcriptional regulator [Paraburkholderia unamae]RAR62417.1 HxlR family transcriptional regulator [Paraburkholderia unamae]
MKTTDKEGVRSHCAVNYGVEIFGDRWSLLIVRDIVFTGKKTYGEFLKSEEGIATNLLASRLAFLEAQGIQEMKSLVRKGGCFFPEGEQ